jgi:hypothetical protein
MAKSRFTAEQIILKLREAEVDQAKGKTIEEVCRKQVSPRRSIDDPEAWDSAA